MSCPADPRLLHSPSSERNREPIAQVLAPRLPASGVILEIASGSGQHVAHFSALNRAITWQPSDPDQASRASISAHIDVFRLRNVRAPLALDVHEQPWPLASAAAVTCCNMIHISPWSTTLALFAGSAQILTNNGSGNGFVFLYGPFLQASVPTAPGNLAFDESLRARNPQWGIRNLEQVAEVAADHGFAAPEVIAMPANNLALFFGL